MGDLDLPLKKNILVNQSYTEMNEKIIALWAYPKEIEVQKMLNYLIPCHYANPIPSN